MFKPACIFIHTFDFTYYSTQISHVFSTILKLFLKESNWENLGSKLGKKITILHWEWGRISAPNLADQEPCRLIVLDE